MDSSVVLDRLRALFTSEDPSLREQGTELLLSLDDPSLFDRMLDGTAHAVAPHGCGGEPFDDLVPGAYFHAANRDHRRALATMCWRVLLLAPDTCAVAAALRPRIQRVSVRPDWDHPIPFIDLAPYAKLPCLERVAVQLRDGGEIRGLDGLARSTSLRTFFVGGGRLPDGVAPLAACESLRELRTDWSCAPASLRGIDQLTSLRVLHIASPWTSPLSTLSALTALESVHFETALSLPDLRAFAPLARLKSLTLKYTSELTSLAGVEHLRALEQLSLVVGSLSTLAPLAGLPALRELTLNHLAAGCDVAALGELPSLKEFRCHSVRVSSLDGLARCDLDVVELNDAQALTSLSLLAGSPRLRSLMVSTAPALTSLDGLRPEAPIESLWIQNTAALTRLGSLPRALKVFTLQHAPALIDLSALTGCPELSVLTLPSATLLADLSPLAGLGQLGQVTLDRATALTDVAALARAPSLHALSLRGCSALTDVTALQGAPSLRAVLLSGSGVTRASVPLALRERCSWEGAATFSGLIAKIAKSHARDAAPLDPLLVGALADDAGLDRAMEALAAARDDGRWAALAGPFEWVAASEGDPGHVRVRGAPELSQARIDRVLLRLLIEAPPASTEALRASIEALHISPEVWTRDVDFARLPPLPALAAVTLTRVRSVAGLDALCAHAKVRAVHWRSPTLKALPLWPALESLTIEHPGTMSLATLVEHAGLRQLTVQGLGERPLACLRGLAKLTSLRSLTVDADAEKGALEVTACTALESLTLQGMQRKTLPADWSALSSLTSLELVGVRGLSDLGFLRPLTSLRSLRIYEASRLRDLRPLASLTALQRLTVERCPWAEDFSPLVGLADFTALCVRYAGWKQPKLPPELESKREK